jgi:hypothetical protein
LNTYDLKLSDMPNLYEEIVVPAQKCRGKLYDIFFFWTHYNSLLIDEERKSVKDGSILVIQEKLQSAYIQLETTKRKVKSVAGNCIIGHSPAL